MWHQYGQFKDDAFSWVKDADSQQMAKRMLDTIYNHMAEGGSNTQSEAKDKFAMLKTAVMTALKKRETEMCG